VSYPVETGPDKTVRLVVNSARRGCGMEPDKVHSNKRKFTKEEGKNARRNPLENYITP